MSMSHSQPPSMAMEFLAGTVAGWAQVLTGHPLDTVKVRLQLSGSLGRPLTMLLSEPWTVWYRGVASPLVGVGACNAWVFGVNRWAQQQCLCFLAASKPSPRSALSSNDLLSEWRQPAWLPCVSGAVAGGSVAWLSCPIELVKIRCQSVASPYRGTWDCVRRTVADEGLFRGLYRGFGITVLRDVPSFAAYFAIYEGLKAHFWDRQNSWSLAVMGALAGIGCWLPAFPQDVIKSRYVVYFGEYFVGLDLLSRIQSQLGQRRMSIHVAVRQLYVEGGLRRFWRGLGPALLRAIPANGKRLHTRLIALLTHGCGQAATFLVYEETMAWLRAPSRGGYHPNDHK